MDFKKVGDLGKGEELITWGVRLLLLTLVVVIVAGKNVVPIQFQNGVVDRVLDLLGAYLVIALFLERAQEVFVKAWRGMGRTELAHDVRDAHAVMLSKNEGSTDYETFATAWLEAKRRLEKYRVRTGKIVVISGSIAGLVVAGAGFGILADGQVTNYLELLASASAGAGISDWQQWVFIAIDAILTGGLIAGGSKGIHSLLTPFGEFLGQSRVNLKQNPADK